MADQTVILLIVGGIVLLAAGGGSILAYYTSKTRHYLHVWWRGGGETRVKLRTLVDKATVVHPATGKPFVVPLDRSMARSTRKGSTRFYVDGETGLPLMWTHRPQGWLEMDAKRLGAMAKETRVQQLADSTREGKLAWLAPYVAPMLIFGALAILGILITTVVILGKVK